MLYTLFSRWLCAEVCKTPEAVSKKYGCDLWVPIQLLTPLLGFGPGVQKCSTTDVMNFKHGERVFTFVCYEDMPTQILASLSQSKTISDVELLERFRSIMKIYILRALHGDVRASELLALEATRNAVKRIEKIRKFKQQLQQ